MSHPDDDGVAPVTHVVMFRGSPGDPDLDSDNNINNPAAITVDQEDAYTLALRACLPPPLLVNRVPVLAFERLPVDLRGISQNNARAEAEEDDKAAAIVVTSARAVWALSSAASLQQEKAIAAIQSLPWFVVGQATARACAEFGVTNILGESAGNAANLLELHILPFHAKRPKAKFTFLCGDLRKPTIVDGLRANNVPFEELVVYKTIPKVVMSSPPIWNLHSKSSIEQKIVAVFFSPSGVDAVKKCEQIPEDFWTLARLVAIGPTTAARLQRVDAVAESPTPEAAALACKKALGG